MTVEQALNMIDTSRLIVHGKRVLFNTWDPEEVAYWTAEGAAVNEFYDPRELRRYGGKLKQGWEVSVEGACERVLVTKLTGEVADKTNETLLNEARRRQQVLA